MAALAWIVLSAAVAFGVDFPPGQIIDAVQCTGEPSQSYALYLPRGYTPDRSWPVIFAFDPGARGRMPVERYQTAAEEYGFIVAGSNNSRNGSPDIGRAIAAMSADVLSRFRIDERRIYVAGMSGGARVAFSVALGTRPQVAGIIASSAGYPDGKLRKTLPFPVFATAGTEDFNHLEMRQLDGALTSPHHLTVFEGGHVWLPAAVAVEAVEWMELQAMKSGLKPRDEGEIDRIFAKRMAAVAADRMDKESYVVLRAIANDFDGLEDIRDIVVRVAALGRDKAIRAALKRDEEEDIREERMVRDVRVLEARLESGDDRIGTLQELRRKWKELSDAAKKADDSTERRLARRALGGLSASVTTTDAEYLKIITEYRTARRGQ